MPISRFYRTAERTPDAVAIARRDGGVTYAQLKAQVNALARAFQAIDATPGSRVGICLKNTPQHLIALLATYAAGKVWVPLSPRYGTAERETMIATTTPSIVIWDDATVDASIAAHAGEQPASVVRDLEDAQIIKFSGGSTGVPKPVVQSVRCLNTQADGIRDFFAFQHDDVNLIAAPLTHGASCFVLPILEVSGTHVLVDDPKAPYIFDAIERHRVTTMYAPPTLLYALMDAPLPPPDFSSLRHVIYSAAPMTPERIKQCQRFFGPVIETAYGQVEAPQIISAMRAHEMLVDENLLSVGRPSPVVTVGIMNPEGALLPSGESGEIVVSGPLLMNGYLHREAETAQALVNGWLHTGDIGIIDARGYLFIRGRLREMINSGGFKVFPGEVEASLARHPAVAECAVFGVPDDKWGEAVNAAVVLNDGMSATADALIQFVKAEMGSVKTPKRIWLVPHLDRNAAGKVSRAGVRASCLHTELTMKSS